MMMMVLCVMMGEVRQSGAGRPRNDLSMEKKEDLEKRLESMSGCLTNRPRKTSALGKGSTVHHVVMKVLCICITLNHAVLPASVLTVLNMDLIISADTMLCSALTASLH